MKLGSKPMSSPGRTDKYPPPLMRFLRTNVGSKSRGRSRSSPMFVRKKTTAIETQEPTSPKVTCMGQVRVKRSKQPGNRTGPQQNHRCRCHCKWIRNACLCPPLPKLKPNSFQKSFHKWTSFSGRKSDTREDSTKNNEPSGGETVNSKRENVKEPEEEEGEIEIRAKFLVYSDSTPPKNALLLTRCRSAPYRSSSLASKFWGSPNEEDERETRETEYNNPISKRDSVSDSDLKIDEAIEKRQEFLEELESSIEENIAKSVEDSEEESESIKLSPKLIRCKSEPARIGEKLVPEIGFSNKRRFGFHLTN